MMTSESMCVQKETMATPPSSSQSAASSSRSFPLNPEASVFKLPTRASPTDASSSTPSEEYKDDQNHPFMNGHVGKELCGEKVPTQDVAGDDALSPSENPEVESSSVSPSHSPEEDQVASSTDNLTSESKMADKEDSVDAAISDATQDQPEDNATDTPPSGESLDSQGNIDQEDPPKDEGTSQPESESEGAAPASNRPLHSTTGEPMSRESIKQLVLEQVQYFFSRENWSRDPYLLSQMDTDQYVPVYILANCSQFKNITKDHSIILEALKESLYVQLDEKNTRVRPNYKRCIVLLREIPEDTPKEEIEGMFKGEGCPKVVSCEFVNNDIWYVTFDSDNDAQKAYTYLREIVKTFKDKPILARMKSKPMSRLHCFSVLPSYPARGGGGQAAESKDSPQTATAPAPQMPPPPSYNSGGMPGSVPGTQPMGPPGGMPPGPSQPNVPGGSYTSGNTPRIYYPPPNNLNPQYNYLPGTGTPPQIPPQPTAYFYPNMVQWPTNYYDINAFIQYNGLTPRGTYKPPNSTNNRYNGNMGGNNNSNAATNRRNKSRDSKLDKNENRHPSGSTGLSGQSRHTQGPSNRPPSVPSPHPNQSTQHSSNQASQSVNNLQKENINNSAAQNGHNIFAQNDPPLASQSNLYTSFSPPAGTGTGVSRGTGGKDKNDASNSPVVQTSSHSSTDTGLGNPVSDSSMAFPVIQNTASPTTSLVVLVPSTAQTQSSAASQTHYTSLSQHISVNQQPSHYQQPHNLPVPSPHRNGFNNDHHSSSREPQPQRQMGRGGRRRGVPRREDEANGLSSGNGRGSLRGPPGSNSGNDFHGKNSSLPDTKKPQFELKETSFPPLPGADEAVVVVPEENPPEPVSQAPWSGESQKFSDVMKGTAKPKNTTTSQSAVEKEVPPPAIEEPSQQPPQQSQPEISNSKAAQNSTQSTSQVVSQDCNATSLVASTTSTNSTTASTTSSNASSTSTTSSTPSISTARNDRMLNQNREQQRPRPDERRSVPQNPRREYTRDFTPGLGRGASRRDRDTERRDRVETGGARFQANKETRPQPASSFRSWREERPDSEGWITKGPRDTRNHRADNRTQPHHYHHHHHSHHNHHSHNFYDNRNLNNKNANMVNGDASPPPSPKPESEKPLSNNIDAAPEEPVPPKRTPPDNEKEPKEQQSATLIEQTKPSVNNNEGEHKPSWAKMALASKDEMEKLAATVKEKDEQERLKKMRMSSRSQTRMQEKPFYGPRDRDAKPFRREPFPPKEKERLNSTDSKSNDKNQSQQPPATAQQPQQSFVNSYRAKEVVRPKSPK